MLQDKGKGYEVVQARRFSGKVTPSILSASMIRMKLNEKFTNAVRVTFKKNTLECSYIDTRLNYKSKLYSHMIF